MKSIAVTITMAKFKYRSEWRENAHSWPSDKGLPLLLECPNFNSGGLTFEVCAYAVYHFEQQIILADNFLRYLFMAIDYDL